MLCFRQLLLGSLPIVMMFDLPESLYVDENYVNKLQEDHDVSISIKPKARQANKSCIVKTQERNCTGLYLARHMLLQLDRQDEKPVKAEIPETYKVPLTGSSSNHVMASMPATKGPYLHANPHFQNMAALQPLSPSYMSLTPVYTPSLARPPSPSWQMPPPPPTTPVSGLANFPTNPQYLQEYAVYVLDSMNRMHQKQEGNVPNTQVLPKEDNYTNAKLDVSRPKSIGQSANGSSGMGSSLLSSPLGSPSKAGKSPRNSSPVHPAGNLTNNLHKLDITGESSGIGGGSAVSVDKNSMSQEISVLLSEMGVGVDRRAPGCEKKVVEIASADYDHQKLLAAKAIHQKPKGEMRTPNPVWSGRLLFYN